jgi:hypothetical protein
VFRLVFMISFSASGDSAVTSQRGEKTNFSLFLDNTPYMHSAEHSVTLNELVTAAHMGCTSLPLSPSH